MECDVCERPGRRKFFCEACLNERLLIHNSSLKRLSASHEATIQKATQKLLAPEGVQERRILKAHRARLAIRIKSLETQRKARIDCAESVNTTLQSKKTQLASRLSRLKEAQAYLQFQRSKRFALSDSGSAVSPTPSQTPSRIPHQSFNITYRLDQIHRSWDQVLQDLVDVRKQLISQLSSIYTITFSDKQSSRQGSNIETFQQCPSQAHSATHPVLSSASLEWRILGLCLPVSMDIKSYHHEEVSAAALYASHLLRLAAMYLGIKLPFQMVMGPVLSVRAPRHSIWSPKHPAPYPLHLTSSVGSAAYPSNSAVAHVAFLTGLCMLAHNAHYLLMTQQRLPPANRSSQALNSPKPTDLLQNLHLFCHSRLLGYASHATGKVRLRRPDDPAHPASTDLEEHIKNVLHIKPEDTVDEEWSIV